MGRRSIGTILGTKFESKHWLALDPCGLLCVLLSFSIHISALIIMILYILCRTQWVTQVLFSIFYIPSLVLALCSLFMVWTSNPGAVPMGARPIPISYKSNKTIKNKINDADDISTDEEDSNLIRQKQQSLALKQPTRGIRRCTKCNNNYKPPRAHHDSITGRCIIKLDHFCPWVGNAIGVWNHKFFFLFIFYTCLSSFFAILILAVKAITCDDGDHSDDGANNSTTAVAFITRNTTRIIQRSNDQSFMLSSTSSNSCDDFYSIPTFYLLTVSILFLFFTCCMLCEQIEPIRKNISKIAALKVKSGQASYAEYASVSPDFNELFGGTSPHCAWHWFIPMSIWFPDDTQRDLVLGYVYDESFGSEPYEEDEEYNHATTVIDGSDSDGTDHNIVIDFEDHGVLLDQPHHDDSKKNILKNILSGKNDENGSRYSKLLMDDDESDVGNNAKKNISMNALFVDQESSRYKTL